MGCDIHCYVERKEDGAWILVSPSIPDRYEPGAMTVERIYRERNYDTFAILADVRNGSDFNIIAAPRGMPEDMSAGLLAAIDEDRAYLGDHSFSWLTLAEILAFDWTQIAKKRGSVHASEWLRWDRWGRADGEWPRRYSGGTSGPGVVYVTEEQMRAAVTALSDEQRGELERMREPPYSGSGVPLAGMYTWAEWETPYWRAASDFLGSVPWRLMQLGPPTRVRLVFGFDS